MGGNWVAVSQLRSYRNIIQIPCKIRNHREVKCSSRRSEVCVILVNRRIDTDIQLKTLSQRIEVFNMKIIMRRDFMIFQSENHKIDNADRRCLSN